MGNVRLSKILKTYNVSLNSLEVFLKSKGFIPSDTVLTASSIISDEYLEIIVYPSLLIGQI
jgi:hypothetical protein